MGRRQEIRDLRACGEHVGKLYPILLGRNGDVIDGKHRLAADKDWPAIRLDHIKTREQVIMARLVGNVCRRIPSSVEKREMLGELGEIFLKEGIKPGDIASKIVEGSGMSYRWVMKYMSAKYKARPGLGGPSKSVDAYESKPRYMGNLCKSKAISQKSKVARLATQEFEQMLSEPRERILKLRNYNNTNFVNLVMERKFYDRLERTAEKLGIELEAIISNMFFLTLNRLEQLALQTMAPSTSEENSWAR
jgi:predicted HTH domain antitoxin